MAIDTKHYKKLLLNKQRELTGNLGRLEDNVKDAQTAEVEDPLDAVTSAQTQATAATEASMTSDVLVAVQDALQRIESGTYGKCIDCGRQIEAKRLEAVPWTPYCLEDQEQHDKAAAAGAQ